MRKKIYKSAEKATILNAVDLAGTIARADFNVQAYSQAIQFILKVDVTYITDLYKEAGRMIG